MLGLVDLREILDRVTYRPGWQFELYQHAAGEGIWLVILADLPDAYHPTSTTIVNIRSAVPPMRDEPAFHEWLSWRLRRVEVHECGEWYRVDGQPWRDPHAPDANHPDREDPQPCPR